MASGKRYEGTGWSMEAAVRSAHDQVPPRSEGHLELGMSRVVEIKIQRDGIVQAISFHAVVEEDLTSEPWAEPPRGGAGERSATSKFTTLVIGEESPPITTMALGEETPPVTTMAVGEEDPGPLLSSGVTTEAVGEEDPPITTLPLNEEDNILTTLALGEEDPPVTTKMVGEEDKA